MDKGHREALRAAARELVREKGLARTTTRDLAGASGANLRSIGYHFGSKDGLMADVIAQISAEWTEAPVAASRLPADAAPELHMASAVRTMLAGLADKRPDLLVYLEGLLEARHSTPLADSLVQTQDAALRAIAQSITDVTPDLPDEITQTLARLLMALHDGLAMQAAVADAPQLRDVELLVWGIAGLGITLGSALGVPGAGEALRSLLAPPQE